MRYHLQQLLRLLRNPRRHLYYGPGPFLMSSLRKRWIKLTHPHATIEFGPGVHIGPGFSLYMPHSGTLRVGANTEFRRGFRAEIVAGAVVDIGANCTFSYHSLIQCQTRVEIGDLAAFGQSLAIFDGNHRYRDLSKPWQEQGFDLRPIRIGKGTVVLTKVTIIHDIGERCVIGAHSFVSKPIPDYSLAAGAPARVLQDLREPA